MDKRAQCPFCDGRDGLWGHTANLALIFFQLILFVSCLWCLFKDEPYTELALVIAFSALLCHLIFWFINRHSRIREALPSLSDSKKKILKAHVESDCDTLLHFMYIFDLFTLLSKGIFIKAPTSLGHFAASVEIDEYALEYIGRHPSLLDV